MRLHIDLISIFPEYFAPLNLSLIGKAQERELVSIATQDLRAFTDDVHQSVDDTPYGGGAGMVMSPEPWGRAIDECARICNRSASDLVHDLIILTPAGRTFTQKMAHDLAEREHIIFACGRYEGIDARVAEFYSAAPHFRVHEISIGNYVLNGGEVAAMVMTEAIVRLIPGVVGNPASLLEESHENGELEYPTYTKPALWRGLEVPEVLLSGHHGAIAAWRKSQSEARTLEIKGDSGDSSHGDMRIS